MADITFSTGVVEMNVNGVRTIRFNPSDPGFAETLYTMIAKVNAIDVERRKKLEKTTDLAKVFDINRNGDKRMADVVDDVFGENFCEDVFDGVRLVAQADGLSVLENFAFAVLDQMDDSVTENLAKRNDRIAHYTAKYEKYKKK